MPTALGPTLAVAALLPMVAPRPQPEHVTAATPLRADVAPTEDYLLSCIEADTALIEKLNVCLQNDGSNEENVTHINHISFGLLDKDWMAVFPDDQLLKGKFIRAFRALLASFYQTDLARLNSTLEYRDKATTYNATNHTVDVSTERLDTTKGSPTLPPASDGTTTEDVYEIAGSDPKISVIHPPREGDSIEETFTTSGPYSVSDTIFEKSSYGGESKYNASTLYDQEVTTSEIGRIPISMLRDLVHTDFYHSSTHELSNTERSYSQETELDAPENKSPPSTNNIFPTEDSRIDLASLPHSIPNIEKDEGRGTDIDENEMFPPLEIYTIAGAEESSKHTKETQNSSDGQMITIGYSTPSVEYNSDGIPTDSSYYTSHNEKSVPNYSIATTNHEKQNVKPADPSLVDLNNQHAIGQAPKIIDSSYVTPSSDLNVEGKENEYDSEGSSGPEPVSHEEQEDNFVDYTVPIGPTTFPADPKTVFTSYTTSNMDAGKSKTDVDESNGNDYYHEESSKTVPPDFHQDWEENSVEENLKINPTSPDDPELEYNSNTPSDLGADKLYIDPSGNDDSGNNRSVVTNIYPTSDKQIPSSTTVTSGIVYDYEKVLVNKTSNTSPESQQATNWLDVTESYTNTKYSTTVILDDLKHGYGTETSVHDSQISAFSSPAPDSILYGKDENNDYNTAKSIICTALADFTSEATQFPNLETFNYKYEVTENLNKNITVPLITVVTSLKPENDGQHLQTPSIVSDFAIKYTTVAQQSETDHEYGGYPNLPDNRIYSYNSTGSVILVSPSPQANNEDDHFLDPVSESKQNPSSTGILDGDRSNTKSADDIGKTTEENTITTTGNKITLNLKSGNRTEFENKFHTFSIPLPEDRKKKKDNAIVNTLHIFPMSNDRILISQPPYKRGCLSQNNCVRVGSSLNSKQRRTPLDNLEGGGEEDLQLQVGDADSVLWWHKMRALKKKSRSRCVGCRCY